MSTWDPEALTELRAAVVRRDVAGIHAVVVGELVAAERIVEGGRVTLADIDPIIRVAEARGFLAPTIELPRDPMTERFDTAKAAVAYLWQFDQAALEGVLGEVAQLAPTPDDAWIPCAWCGR